MTSIIWYVWFIVLGLCIIKINKFAIQNSWFCGLISIKEGRINLFILQSDNNCMKHKVHILSFFLQLIVDIVSFVVVLNYPLSSDRTMIGWVVLNIFLFIFQPGDFIINSEERCEICECINGEVKCTRQCDEPTECLPVCTVNVLL